MVGLSNAAFQDIIYRAGLHPKRRASDLSPEERRALYDAMRFVTTERLRLGGKATFRDLYGVPGGYEPAMGPGMKGAVVPGLRLAHPEAQPGRWRRVRLSGVPAGDYMMICLVTCHSALMPMPLSPMNIVPVMTRV